MEPKDCPNTATMGLQLPRLRSWNDFLPGQDRFALPDFKDVSKWNHRMVNNLLYYQSNYLVLAGAFVFIVGFLDPIGMLLGGAVVILLFAGFVWALHLNFIRKFKERFPVAFVIVILVPSSFLITFFGGIIVFKFGIAFPLLLIFAHASLRLRNVRNKLENTIENIGLKITPMGIVLLLLEHHEGCFGKLDDKLSKENK